MIGTETTEPKVMLAVNSSAEIPDDMTEAEVQAFWDTHYVGEGLLAEGIDEEHARVVAELDEQIDTTTALPFYLQLNHQLEQRVQHIAKLEGISYQRLIEQFVLERTYQEELRLGIIK